MHTSLERVFFASSLISILLTLVAVVLLVFKSTGREYYILREHRRYVGCENEFCSRELEKVQSMPETRTVHHQDGIPQRKDLDTVKLECINEGPCSDGLSMKQGLSKATSGNQKLVLDPSYRNTMVKLGTDLKFDATQCPAGSYMLNRSLHHGPPKHSNCPTLYIVGARKGGTTSLYQYVSKHPDFLGIKLDAGPKVGEVQYFQRPKPGSWKHYRSLFPATGNTTMTGESSVSYLVGAPVPKRLHSMCGKQARVVMLLRNPAKRLESNFLMRVKYHTTKFRKQPISALVNDQLNAYFKAAKETTSTPTEWSRLVGLFPPARNMVFEGLYYVHLLNWLCNFPAENILIINSEEFFEKPNRILDIVFQFLGLKRLDTEMYGSITSATYNKGSYDVPKYQKLSHEDVESLMKAYKPFNQALLELLQWEDPQW